MGRAARSLTPVALAGIAGLHVAWGLGSTFPFSSHDALSDAVVGSQVVPSPAACYAVAGALIVAGGLVADAPIAPPRLRRLGRIGVATVLAVRGLAGALARTDLLSPGSTSPRFRELDRRFYSPLCFALAFGAAVSQR